MGDSPVLAIDYPQRAGCTAVCSIRIFRLEFVNTTTQVAVLEPHRRWSTEREYKDAV